MEVKVKSTWKIALTKFVQITPKFLKTKVQNFQTLGRSANNKP